ncbi:MAG: GFA family protein [Geminicoccaceae bacterium]
MSNDIVGHCLCGKISYRADTEPAMIAVCHCRHCQRQSGTAFSIVVAVPANTVVIEGETTTYDDRGASGKAVQRIFCGSCGSPIVSRVEAMPEIEFIKAGTLDDPSWLEPTLEIWCDHEQPWLQKENERARLPGNPPV